MNLRDLLYFVTLAGTRHFGRAAETVHVSQPTLSSQIRKLEEFLGVTLFERGRRKFGLTPVGEAVLNEAKAVLAHADAIEDIAKAHRDPLAGVLSLGAIASLAPFIAPELLGQLAHDAPRLEIILNEGLTDELIEAVRNREMDAALIATKVDGNDLQETLLFDEPFLVAFARDHPLATKRELKLHDIEAGTLLLLDEGHCLRDQALSLCGADSIDARVRATSLLTLMRLAEEGRGTTLVPALAAGLVGGLVLRSLKDNKASRRIRLVTRRNYPRMGALQVITDAARAVAGVHELQISYNQ